MTNDRINAWWLSLSEEQREDIYLTNNTEATDGDWSDWWYYMSEDERKEVYEENIEDTSNTVDPVDVDAYVSDTEFEAQREIERGGDF